MSKAKNDTTDLGLLQSGVLNRARAMHRFNRHEMVDFLRRCRPDQFSEMPIVFTGIHSTKYTRRRFSKAKKFFLKSIFERASAQPDHAGFSDDQLANLKAGYNPDKGNKKVKYSVDHVVDLQLGGTNEEDNLCLVPHIFNVFKMSLINTQIAAFIDEKDDKTIYTWAPKNEQRFVSDITIQDQLARDVLLEAWSDIKAKSASCKHKTNPLQPMRADPYQIAL